MDSVDGFKEAIRANGLRPPEQIVPGRFHRFPGIGKRKGSDGWCKLFPDGQGGVFGDYSADLSKEWHQEREQAMTSKDKSALRRMVERSQKESALARLAENEQAATAARDRWSKAGLVQANHPYLVKKRLSGQGLKQGAGKLLVPMRDQGGKLWAIQTIDRYGGKLFQPKGCRTSGLYFSIGDQPREGAPVCVCEGWATGAAIHEATGCSVAVAFNAGNIVDVAKIVRDKFPDNPVIICADDDQKEGKGGNVGIDKAREAANVVGAYVAEPNMGCKADFWDLWQESGAGAVFEALQRALSDNKEKHLQSEGFSLDDSLKAATDLVEQTRGNCGAPFTPESLQLLASIKNSNKGIFMQVRHDLKKANRSLVISELDRDISRELKKNCPYINSSSFSNGYDKFTPALKANILQFKDKWVFRRKRPVALPRKRPPFCCENNHQSGENGQGVRVSHGGVFLSFHRFCFLVKH